MSLEVNQKLGEVESQFSCTIDIEEDLRKQLNAKKLEVVVVVDQNNLFSNSLDSLGHLKDQRRWDITIKNAIEMIMNKLRGSKLLDIKFTNTM